MAFILKLISFIVVVYLFFNFIKFIFKLGTFTGQAKSKFDSTKKGGNSSKDNYKKNASRRTIELDKDQYKVE